jgi:hypothetical protein
MTRLRRIALYAGMVALAATIANTSANGGAIYTVRDVGVIGGSLDRPDGVQIGDANSSGTRLLQIDAAGHITPPGSGPDPASYTGPLPSGMRPLNEYYPHASPDGQYLAGTAFADQTPQAYWGGFVVHNGQARVIETLSGSFQESFSTAYGVNDAGTAVGMSGVSSHASDSRAIMVDASGRITNLGSLLGGYTAALGINNSGTTIVGMGENFEHSNFQAFISDGHTMTNLNTLIAPIAGFTLASATGVNDAGQIAAYGHFASDPYWIYHELLLSPSSLNIPSLLPVAGSAVDANLPGNSQPNPIPEPATLALIVVAVGVWARRRRDSVQR